MATVYSFIPVNDYTFQFKKTVDAVDVIDINRNKGDYAIRGKDDEDGNKRITVKGKTTKEGSPLITEILMSEIAIDTVVETDYDDFIEALSLVIKQF
jgi:hypothetical protein